LQPNLQSPSSIHPKRKQFESDYQKYGFKYVMRRYGDDGMVFRIRRLLSRMKNKLKQLF